MTVTPRRITGVLKFFRRDRDGDGTTADPAAEAAAVFWRRWARLRPAVAAALDAGELHLVEARVASAVATLDGRLGWSLAGGGDPDERYTLVITGEGDERLRALTDAWLAAAPDDPRWEYHDCAQAMDDPADFTLGISGLQVALADVRVTALPDADKVHVAVFHPAMARLRGEDRDVLSFVALDTALGERVVERRIGIVEPVLAEPANAMDLLGLRALVSDHDRGRQPAA